MALPFRGQNVGCILSQLSYLHATRYSNTMPGQSFIDTRGCATGQRKRMNWRAEKAKASPERAVISPA